MADYFTHFSCLIDVGTADKATRALALFHDLRAADQDVDDPEVAGFDLSRQDAPCLLYTSPSPRDGLLSRMPSSA